MHISKYIGKPYEKGGRGPNTFDCYGLASTLYEKFNGIALPELFTPDNAEMCWQVFVEQKTTLYKRLQGPRPFCIVTFKLRPPYITHLGIVLEDRIRFIHILKKRNVTIERLDMMPWDKKIEGYYELINSKD